MVVDLITGTTGTTVHSEPVSDPGSGVTLRNSSGCARVSRRHFLKVGFTGAMLVAIGGQAKLVSELTGGTAFASPALYDLTITDAMVEMVDLKRVYHRVFASDQGAHLPGPILHMFAGDEVEMRITNRLDEPHALAIYGTPIATGPIAPGATAVLRFNAPAAGTYIYLDPTDAPVNRLLGLHGTMIVLPAEGSSPYSDPPERLGRLFADLGSAAHFPGEAWTPERTRVWHIHTIDPRWHATAQAGGAIVPAQMAADYKPRYFTVNGQSGFFASHNPVNSPVGRIGQPHLIRIVNTGMASQSLHIHGNHVYLCAEGGVMAANVRHIDSWHLPPMGRVDWLLPFVRPPDIAGPEELPLRQVMAGELGYRDALGVPQCPLEYPMHCHMEMSQTAHGGNYPGGLVTHWAISGDLDMDFSDAGFPCLPTEQLAVPHVHLGRSDG